MAKIRIYQYEKCSTCRKALRYLAQKGVNYEAVPIAETPPGREELMRALKTHGGDLRKLFNTAGRLYREMQLRKKIKTLSPDEGLSLLRENGMLVKRPFVVTDEAVLVGFKEAEWDRLFQD